MLHIKDIFDIDKTIMEHGKKILLLGGVGSGKSTWVTEVLTKKGRVLFITSRKAKVQEDTKGTCFKEAFEWYTSDNQTLITNAKLTSLVERIADDYQRDLDEFIDHFDYIVVDEVHSIATDSAYAESCFGVLSFIEYAVEKDKIVVCMTGTPEPIQQYFDDNGWYTADLMEKCDYIHPKRVSLIQQREILSTIQKHCQDCKIIYFSNHTDTLTALCKDLIETNIVTAGEVAISISKSREKDYFEKLSSELSTENYKRIEETSKRTYDNIIEKKFIPDDCRILISTSVLKEGINIKNPNVVMFCENHVLSNLIQYFGRAREGNTEVYIIEDSDDYPIKHDELLYDYAIDSELETANTYHRKRIDDERNVFSKIERQSLIKHITRNPYIYFDYIRNQYRIFHVKFHEEERLKTYSFWCDKLNSHCNRYGITQRWFNVKNDYVRILIEQAEQQLIFWGDKQIQILKNFISTAYGITGAQPKRINGKLAEKNIPIRIYNDKGSAGDKRDVKYWQLLLVEDFETLKLKKKKK